MRFWFFFLLASISIAAVPAQKTSVANQLADFEVFKEVLTSKEGRLDLHQTADSMHFYLDFLQKQLSEERSITDQYKLYSRVIAKLGCGHTQIHPSKEILKEWISSEKSLPLDFVMQGKRLFTNKLLSTDYKVINLDGTNLVRARRIKPNYEIIELDHKTIEQIVLDISPFISSDEGGIDFKYHQVAQLFDFYRHLSSPFETDSVQIQYVKGSDTLETYLNLGYAPVNTINTRLKKSAAQNAIMDKEIGTFKVVRSKYGVFRFRSFTACSGKAYEQFLERSFEKIKSKEITRIIVDLRGNTGGIMQYSLMSYFTGEDVVLGKYVVEKPKKGVENKHLQKWNSSYRKHKRMSRSQKRQVRRGKFEEGAVKTSYVNPDLIFEGDIVVITDEATFSAGSMLACHLKTMCDAKIVGRTAGGSFYRGNAGTLVATLPNSKFNLMVNPNTFYSHLPLSDTPAAIKQPDVLLNPGFLKSRKVDDYYLKAAINSFN